MPWANAVIDKLINRSAVRMFLVFMSIAKKKLVFVFDGAKVQKSWDFEVKVTLF
jgi:hypothetical protein